MPRAGNGRSVGAHGYARAEIPLRVDVVVAVFTDEVGELPFLNAVRVIQRTLRRRLVAGKEVEYGERAECQRARGALVRLRRAQLFNKQRDGYGRQGEPGEEVDAAQLEVNDDIGAQRRRHAQRADPCRDK